jgi:hypothetical protein
MSACRVDPDVASSNNNPTSGECRLDKCNWQSGEEPLRQSKFSRNDRIATDPRPAASTPAGLAWLSRPVDDPGRHHPSRMSKNPPAVKSAAAIAMCLLRSIPIVCEIIVAGIASTSQSGVAVYWIV